MKRRNLLFGILVTMTILILGGCGMTSQKETLTKEQQDNVVRGIVKNYKIESIEFIKFNKDINTGSYHLIFVINNDKKYKTGITVSEIAEFDERLDHIGLSPIDDFIPLERKVSLEETDDSFKKVKIIYLGE